MKENKKDEMETGVGNEAPISKADKRHKILTIVGIVICVLLLPVLVINCILLIKGAVNEDEVPSIGGKMPLIVLTDSMYPEIKSGDIIICEQIDTSEIKVGDVISFFDPAGNGTSVVTHQVIAIETTEKGTYYQTKGTNNNTADRLWVAQDAIIGIYTGTRLGGVGHVALFMQSTAGLIVCILVPLALFVGYEFLRRKKTDKEKQDDMSKLLQELEALKAAQATQQSAETEAATIENADENAS